MNDAARQDDVAVAFEHHQAGRREQAEAICRRLLSQNPNDAPALHLLALMAQQQRRLPVALKLARLAIAANPAEPEFHHTLGTILGDLRRWDGAAAALRVALRLRRDWPAAWHNLANVYARAGQLAEGRDAYRQSLQLGPEPARAAETCQALIAVCHEANNLAGMLDGQRRLAELRPDDPRAASALLYAMHYDPAITSDELFAAHRSWAARFADHLGGSAAVMGSSSAATRPAQEHTPPSVLPIGMASYEPGRRLRVGYVSASFRDHPVARFQQAEMAARDRSAYDLICYSSVAGPDAVTERLKPLADVWRDVADLNDEQLAEQIRVDGIDVLVDLDGHDLGNRLLCFARRPAPVQVTYNGYIDTTGLVAMDWKLTDEWLDPPGATERYHTEQLYRLPGGAWCYASDHDAPPPAADPPAAMNGFITFGSMNRPIKACPATLRAWSRVMEAVPGSRLLFLTAGGAHTHEAVRSHITQHGIDPLRLELLARAPRRAYLEAFNRIDVCLDPFPFAGMTTTCDALWMGVPTISLLGDRFWSRSGLSLLPWAGLENLMANDEGEYIRLAAGLANDLSARAALRRTLRQRIAVSPLCDGRRMATELAEAYRSMWRATVLGEPLGR